MGIHHFRVPASAYGAGAIHPYLALASVRALEGQRGFEQTTRAELEAHHEEGGRPRPAQDHVQMGISAIARYRGGAQIFEAVGVNQGLVDRCFAAPPPRSAASAWREIDAEVRRRHDEKRSAGGASARPPAERGLPLVNRKDGEHHGYNRLMVIAAQKASQSGDPADYKAYADLVGSAPPRAIRDVLEWVPAGPPGAARRGEPASEIVKRFASSAMSLGALSPKAHATLAIA